MWSNDMPDSAAAEAWISAAATLPRTTSGYRARVLEEAFQAQRQSVSLHRVQTLTTSLLALIMLVWLPGYYSSLRDPGIAVPSGGGRMSDSRGMMAAGLVVGENFEWSLVESALAARDHSARAFQGTL